MRAISLLAFLALCCGTQILQAQSNMVFIRIQESNTKLYPSYMVVLHPDDEIEKIALEAVQSDETYGRNAIKIRNEINKWEKEGFSEITTTSLPLGYTIMLRKKE